MDDYIKQMQEYLNKNSSKNENNEKILEEMDKNLLKEEEPHSNLDKDELFDHFHEIINNSNNDKVQENQNNIETKKIQNFDDMPLPTLKNQKKDIPKASNNNNIDDMPIKGNNNLNFNELLEKELSKEQNEGNFNNNIQTKPKFKYIPKKKVDLVSAPTNTKKYKYYSDNFKPKNRGRSVNVTKKVNNKNNVDIERNNEEEILNNSDDHENYNKNQGKKKRVAPVMPENFKNSKFNRGKGYTGPLTVEKQENKIENNINEKNINKLWGDFQKNYEQKDEEELEDFHDDNEDDEIKMNNYLDDNKTDKNNTENNLKKNNYDNNNKININNDIDDEEIPIQQEEPKQEKLENKEKEDFGVINEDYIKKLMNYDVHDVEDILNLNNKISSGNEEILDINKKEDDHKNNFDTDNIFNNNLLNKKDIEEENENELNINKIDKIDITKENNDYGEEEENKLDLKNDEEEDNREIYKMFENKLYQNEPVTSNIKPQQIKMNKDKPIPINAIKNQQSRLMNKYFGNALNSQNNNNTKKNNNKQKPVQNNKNNNVQRQKNINNKNNNMDNNEQINELVNKKITELNKIIEKLKKDNIKVIDLKKEYERLSKKFKLEVEEYNKKR